MNARAHLLAEPKVKAIVALMEQPGSRAATSAEANEKVYTLHTIHDVGCVFMSFARMHHCKQYIALAI
jgi:hypothetical protein